MKIELNGSIFTLLPDKALYKEDEGLLVIADIHLGKAGHFRKEGISIPAKAQADDYLNLEKLFKKIQPRKVYFLGDLFHSSFNKDWHLFTALIELFPDIQFTLVKGNHDIIDEQLFSDLGINVVNEIEDTDFIYTHHPLTRSKNSKLNIAGHIHPGIRLSGLARQGISLPCFYCKDNVFLLPAFGILTGCYTLSNFEDADIFIVLQDSVRKI